MNAQTFVELRSADFVDAEVKGYTLRGYAAVFDTPWNDELTEKMGYVEETARGTFRKALSRSPQVPLRWQSHITGEVLATTEGKTLSLEEDGKGLLVKATLPRSPIGEHAKEMILRGDVKGMSYGIETLPSDSKLERIGRGFKRVIHNAQSMLDVTLTWEPAYRATSVELRTIGFAAAPLQTLVEGDGTQLVEDVGDSPDDAKAWWGDEEQEPDSAPKPRARPAWQIVIDELEKEGEF